MDERVGELAPPSPGWGDNPGQPAVDAFAQARQTTEEIRNEAAEKVQQAGERARQGIEEGKHRVAERLRRVSSSLGQMSERLPEEDRSVSRYADRAREGIDRAARYIDATSIDTAVRDVERLAKRSPALFYGVAFAIGVAAARFLKSRPASGGSPGIDRSEGVKAWPP